MQWYFSPTSTYPCFSAVVPLVLVVLSQSSRLHLSFPLAGPSESMGTWRTPGNFHRLSIFQFNHLFCPKRNPQSFIEMKTSSPPYFSDQPTALSRIQWNGANGQTSKWAAAYDISKEERTTYQLASPEYNYMQNMQTCTVLLLYFLARRANGSEGHFYYYITLGTRPPPQTAAQPPPPRGHLRLPVSSRFELWIGHPSKT